MRDDTVIGLSLHSFPAYPRDSFDGLKTPPKQAAVATKSVYSDQGFDDRNINLKATVWLDNRHLCDGGGECRLYRDGDG